MSDPDFESKHPRIPAGEPGGGQFTHLEGSEGGDPLQVASASFGGKAGKGQYKKPTVAAMQGVGDKDPKNAAKYDANFQKAVGLFHNEANYPNFTKKDLEGTAQQQAKNIVDHMAANDKFLYEHAGEKWLNQGKMGIVEGGKLWYMGANARSLAIAERDKVNPASMAAVIAKLSPTKDWEMNVEMADRLSHIYANQQDHKWDAGMTKTANETIDKQMAAYAKASKHPDGSAEYKETRADKEASLSGVRNKTLAQCETDDEKARWIRVYDETHHSSSYSSFNPDGSRGANVKNNDGSDKKLVWQSNTFIADGIRAIKANGNPDKISDILGDGHKVRSFYNNILDPMSPNRDVTADTHQVGASLMRSGTSGVAVAVAQNFALSPADAKNTASWEAAPKSKVTGINGTYAFHTDGVRQAADAVGIHPNQMQAIVWEVKRQSFGRASDAALAKVEDIWHEYHAANGAMSQSTAQERVWNTIREDVQSRSGAASPDRKGEDLAIDPDRAVSRYEHAESKGTPTYLGPKGDNPEDFL